MATTFGHEHREDKEELIFAEVWSRAWITFRESGRGVGAWMTARCSVGEWITVRDSGYVFLDTHRYVLEHQLHT